MTDLYFFCDVCRERFAADDEETAQARAADGNTVYYVCSQCLNNGAFYEFIQDDPPTRRAVWRNGRFEFEPINAPGVMHLQPVEAMTGETYPGRGDYRLTCDHCGRDNGLFNCGNCGGVTCGICAAQHTHRTPTTNGSGADDARTV